MTWIPTLTKWLSAAGPSSPPLPDLPGAPPELVDAVRGLASRLGAEEAILIDVARFAELASLGDPTLVRHVTQTFFGAVPTQLSQLRTAVDGADAAGVRGVAHTIKGGAASAGLPAASAAAADLEDAARAGETVRFEALFAVLVEAIARTEQAVDAKLG